jgi:hypothetical protein
VTRRLFVPAHNHRDKSKRIVIYMLAFRSDGTSSSPSVFYEQAYTAWSPLLYTVPFVPGFSVRADTGALSMVDEQERKILVFLCSTYVQGEASIDSATPASCPEGPAFSTSYGAAMYKDLEFIGRVTASGAYWMPLSSPVRSPFRD